MKRFVLLLTLASLIFGSSCSSQKFHTTRIQRIDFNTFKTYGWLPPVDSLSKDYYSNDIAKDKILSTANQEIESRGLQYTKENPDVLFRYVAIVNNKSRLVYSNPGWGWGGPWGMMYSPWGWGGWGMGYYGGFSQPVGKERVRYGHIIIEAIDRKSNAVIWQARGSEQVDEPERTINRLPKMVTGIMKEYPVRSKKN